MDRLGHGLACGGIFAECHVATPGLILTLCKRVVYPQELRWAFPGVTALETDKGHHKRSWMIVEVGCSPYSCLLPLLYRLLPYLVHCFRVQSTQCTIHGAAFVFLRTCEQHIFVASVRNTNCGRAVYQAGRPVGPNRATVPYGAILFYLSDTCCDGKNSFLLFRTSPLSNFSFRPSDQGARAMEKCRARLVARARYGRTQDQTGGSLSQGFGLLLASEMR